MHDTHQAGAKTGLIVLKEVVELVCILICVLFDGDSGYK